MVIKDIQKLTDVRLRIESYVRLVQGVVPFDQWAAVFANPQLMGWRGLRCKAFSVWFPTMFDFILARPESKELAAEAARRGVSCDQVFALGDELASRMRDVLATVSRDEQIFIRDRRLQNVHGMLHIYSRDDVTVKWFSTNRGAVITETIPIADYNAINAQFYFPDLIGAEFKIVKRVCESTAFTALGRLYDAKLTTAHLQALEKRLAIGPACS